MNPNRFKTNYMKKCVVLILWCFCMSGVCRRLGMSLRFGNKSWPSIREKDIAAIQTAVNSLERIATAEKDKGTFVLSDLVV